MDNDNTSIDSLIDQIYLEEIKMRFYVILSLKLTCDLITPNLDVSIKSKAENIKKIYDEKMTVIIDNIDILYDKLKLYCNDEEIQYIKSNKLCYNKYPKVLAIHLNEYLKNIHGYTNINMQIIN